MNYDEFDRLTCALQREPGTITDSDRNEITKFAAALRARANGKTTQEAYELVYGDAALNPVGEA